MREHDHPFPALDRAAQAAALGLAALLVAAVLALVAGVFVGLPGAFLLMALALLALLPFLLMQTFASPAITVMPDGLALHHRLLWRAQTVAWADVRALKDYPLLPPPDSETLRRVLVGRRKYQQARGKLLVLRAGALPVGYRLLGLYCGEGFTPALALTNRTHAGYDALLEQVERALKLKERLPDGH